MATTITNSLFCILTITILLSSILPYIQATEEPEPEFQPDNFVVELTRKRPLREKLSHFRIYWHDIVNGRNATSVPVVKPPRNMAGPNGFGQVNMIDNLLTQGPEKNSKILGKAQGLYAYASQEEFGLMMAMDFLFTTGKYNGSTITIIGRNAVYNPVREMPVIGGSGLFRFARGYAQARTHVFDLKTGDATVEYNIYVLHY